MRSRDGENITDFLREHDLSEYQELYILSRIEELVLEGDDSSSWKVPFLCVSCVSYLPICRWGILYARR